jgi:hypothetical protein
MALPDFFIIGAPKCGTTTLYGWLGQHPQANAPHKEPGFFSQDLEPTAHLPTHIPSLEAYEAIFDTDDPAVLVSGEATPKYLYSDNALDQIARLRPDARIIICLRDPIDLALSFHNQKIREGAECEPDFARAWSRAVIARAPGPLSLEPWLDGRINYAFWASYGRRLEQVFSRFPRRNIRIYTIQDLKQDPEGTFRDLCGFLGISQTCQVSLTPSNPGYHIRSARLHLAMIALKRRMAPVLRLIARARGKEGLGILKLARRLNSSAGHYASSVSPQLKEEMKRALAADRARAERLLDGKQL